MPANPLSLTHAETVKAVKRLVEDGVPMHITYWKSESARDERVGCSLSHLFLHLKNRLKFNGHGGWYNWLEQELHVSPDRLEALRQRAGQKKIAKDYGLAGMDTGQLRQFTANMAEGMPTKENAELKPLKEFDKTAATLLALLPGGHIAQHQVLAYLLCAFHGCQTKHIKEKLGLKTVATTHSAIESTRIKLGRTSHEPALIADHRSIAGRKN